MSHRRPPEDASDYPLESQDEDRPVREAQAIRPDNLAAVLSDAARLDPDFFEELTTLSMTIDEYERILAADEPTVVTTDNTVG